jgi:hypothetical protein
MATFETEIVETPMSPTPHFRTNPNSRQPQRRTNKFGGKCVNCYGWVEAGQGYLSNAPSGGKWAVEHRDCSADEGVTPMNFKVPEGRYTIQFEDGSYRTLRVRKQDDTDDFMPGKVLLSYLSGANNDSDYTSFAHVAGSEVKIWKRHRHNHELIEAVKVLLDSPDRARESYAERSGCCSRCGRTLTVPTSLHAGLGPECAKKMGV